MTDFLVIGALTAVAVGLVVRQIRDDRSHTGLTLLTDPAPSALVRERDHVRQIGFALGFKTAGQFVVAVRHVVGRSPTEFRHLLNSLPLHGAGIW